MSCLLNQTSKFSHLHSIAMSSNPYRQPLAAKNISITAPVRQPKMSSTVLQGTGTFTLTSSGSANSNSVPSQPMQTGSDVSAETTPPIANDHAAACSAVKRMQSQTGVETAASSEGMHHEVSIPGQVEAHQHLSAGSEDTQLPCMDRPAGLQSAPDCNVDRLIDVTEQSCGKPTEGMLLPFCHLM